MKFKVHDNDKLKAGDVMVCVVADDPDAAVFRDDAYTPCADCGVKLRHRPYVPKRVTKLCLPCTNKRLAANEAGVEIELGVTEHALRDLALFYSKGRRQ